MTLQPNAGIKAWEAYLVLIVSDGSAANDLAGQDVQRDVNYCRKIVIDGSSITAADDPRTAMEAVLSFFFPQVLARQSRSTSGSPSH